MQIDSIVRRALPEVALLVAIALLLGCASDNPVVHDDLLEPLAVERPWLPGDADLAAARLARAALVAKGATAMADDAAADPLVEAALDELESLERDEEQPYLPALAVDLRNATLDDPIEDREASRKLARRRGLDPRLEARLDRLIRDDPLELAGRRQFDGWHRLWARTFNAVVEPIGSSAITGFVLAPYQLANSLIHYFAEFSNAEALSSTDRQALALRREYVARHPDTAITPKVQRKVDRDEPKLAETFARRSLRAAERAFDAQAWQLALHHADYAATLLGPWPEENGKLAQEARALANRASSGLEAHRALQQRSLEAIATPAAMAATERELAIGLLLETRTPLEIRLPIPDAPADGEDALDPGETERYVRARTEYLRAMAQYEAGFESGARRRLTRAAREGVDDDTMARHARVLLDDDWQNPHGAFTRLARKASRDELAWRLAGEWVRRPRYPNLPSPVAYLIDAPAIAITIIMAPIRALISPFTGGTPDFRRGAALAGYRYLMRYPAGEERRAVTQWLYDYELSQERYGRALRMADWIPEFDAEERADLVERTAEERVERIDELDRRDERSSILSGVAREFPDSAGGRSAGLRARAEREDASPQHIRITREFLLENPEVAGRRGVGLNPALLDDSLANGELHPEGIVLRGGRMLEVRLVAEGADDEDPPASRYVELSPRRLRQLSSTLVESARRNGLIDPDARQEVDPQRDLFLERAALGLTDEMDARATAESDFVYLSLRERYGIVRGRDSVLPFDLVFRGSLGDFTLGAFPRWRPPRETPDAFLYR